MTTPIFLFNPLKETPAPATRGPPLIGFRLIEAGFVSRSTRWVDQQGARTIYICAGELGVGHSIAREDV